MLKIQRIKHVRRWSIALLAAILMSGTAITLASPSTLSVLTQSSGSGYDPLAPGEESRAVAALGIAPETQALTTMGSVTDAPTELLLLVERHQEEKAVYVQGNWQRRADVYIYRYVDDVLIHQIFNFDTNQVDSVVTAQGIQLPLLAVEEQRALTLALDNPDTRRQIEADYLHITGQPLASSDQLQVKAMTFHADSMPNTELGSAAACGIRRCAQLLITAGENIVLQTIPIVDLSTGIVAHVLTFGG
jgi:hypothetical protein